METLNRNLDKISLKTHFQTVKSVLIAQFFLLFSPPFLVPVYAGRNFYRIP